MTQKQPYQLEVKIKELEKTPNHDAQILAFLRELRARRKQQIIYHPRLFYTVPIAGEERAHSDESNKNAK